MLKVGEIVKVRPDLKPGQMYGFCRCYEDNSKAAGLITKIDKVIDAVFGEYGLENCGMALFSEQMLIPVVKPTINDKGPLECCAYLYQGNKIKSSSGSDIPAAAGLNDFVNAIHKNAVEHGWWDEERSFAEIIALCHSELSEALEADRSGEPLIWDNKGKPDGAAVEMADCMIRIMDWFGKMKIDLDAVIRLKHAYNQFRPYKHGRKY